MKRCVLAIIFSIILFFPADGRFLHGSGILSGVTSFGTFFTGAGGLVDSIDIASDGTKAIRTDVGGGYYCAAPCAPGGANKWIQVISSASMPSADTNVGLSSFTGLYEIRLAPSSPTTFYLYYINTIYKGSYSSGSISLTKTNFTPVSVTSNNTGSNQFGPFMAVDPQNPLIAIVGTPASGAFYTTDGTNFTSISGLCTPSTPSGGTQGGGYYIAFDPTSSVVGGITQGVYIGCYGTGTYHSTTGPSGTFTQTSGGPTTFRRLMVASDGSVCAAANSGAQNLWGFFSGSWTNINSGSQGGRNYAPVEGSGKFYASIDTATDLNMSSVQTHCGNGGTWSAAAFNNILNQISPDIGWISGDYNFSGPNMDGSAAVIDPANNLFYATTGVGVIHAPIPSSTTGITWTDQSAGIEELVANRVFSCPGGYGPFTLVWDRQIFNAANSKTSYPSAHGVTQGSNNSNQIIGGWDGDCSVPNTGFIACICDSNVGQGESSGYSTDGGVTWHVFSAFPADIASSKFGGSMAVGDNQTILWAVAQNGHLNYTSNQGTSWGTITCAGVPTTGTLGWDSAVGYVVNRKIVDSDKSLTNTFYAYNRSVPGFFKITFSGGTPTCTATWGAALDGGGNDGFNASLRAVPGQASNLFYTSGFSSSNLPFWRSTNGGTNWSQVSGVTNVQTFGFGAAKPGGGGYPAIFIVGQANSATVPGLYRSDDNASTWIGPLAPCLASITTIGSCPNGSIDLTSTIDGDLGTYGELYIGYKGTGFVVGTIH